MARILLVEDNEMIRDMLSERLERKGFHVYRAVDGAEGVEVAKVEKPDLILLDMSLPIMDGWQAARQLKANDETEAIPIIALTAHAIAGDRERTLGAGCDDYSRKPVDFPQLLFKIQTLLKKEQAL